MSNAFITTFKGEKFHPLYPKPEEVNIIDIAHSLANQCRFTGHSKHFYSVAQHSVLVSHHCDPVDAFWGLLHDASEAYLCDVARPIKHHPAFKFYREAEEMVQAAISIKFAISSTEPESVKLADRRILATEARDLMANTDGWDWPYEPYPTIIRALSPIEAKTSFIDRFYELAPVKFMFA